MLILVGLERFPTKLRCKYMRLIAVNKHFLKKIVEKTKKNLYFLVFCPLIGRKTLILQLKFRK